MGAQYYVPGDMTYQEWKEKFVDSGSKEGLLQTDYRGTMEWKRTAPKTKVEVPNPVEANQVTGYSSTSEVQSPPKISGALDSSGNHALTHAKKYYNSVRKMTTDCKTIAQRTDFSLSFVEIVKKHLFLAMHDLGGDEPECFYPDYDIAQSWQRLSTKNAEILPHDLILLLHEYAEQEYMLCGLPQREAYDKANEKYNYKKALLEKE